ncbi:Y-family DNA polymerase [Novosphingobium aerophilum]|uniref:Y-family DNA polymerase n=1 Tax=Novosphingobium aerophilum TaxID=2839843 RepID=UPI002E286E97|nr:DNA polymerase Y family protein [Novosphingobium aerophilum]
MRRRYLALWFPFLPADRWRIEQGASGEDLIAPPCAAPPEAGAPPPLAFVTRVGGALRLAAVDRTAQRLGIVAGLTLADARARHPNLAVADMDPEADRHLLQRLARRCQGWSPLVTPVPPDAVVLDSAGSDHLFGGEVVLAGLVEDSMAELGLTCRLARADTPEAALALARHTPGPATDEGAALRALPVAALGLDAEATLALRRAGLKTLGDCAARPAASLAARFGAGAVTALRRLLGDEARPIAPMAQPAPLRFERRFAEPVAHERAVAACFHDLLQEAAGALERRGLGGRRFRLVLLRSDGARHRLQIETGAPTRDPALVLRLFDERIGTLADPLDPGFGYDSIVLGIPLAEPLAAVQPALDGRESAAAVLAELIDRLSTRLGPGGLLRLVPHDSHIPERGQQAVPASQVSAPLRWPAPPPGEPPLRPIVLFDPPQPVEVIAEVPDGPPHRFRWRRQLHEVRLYEGPERIAAEWWRRRGGEGLGQGGLTRDYYRIEDAHGHRYWLFRHGLYDEKPAPRWYMHGLFA